MEYKKITLPRGPYDGVEAIKIGEAIHWYYFRFVEGEVKEDNFPVELSLDLEEKVTD